MTVTGTQQRVYGTLTGGCMIDLHRFALVSGSTTDSPTTAVTVTYADTTPYKQCGYKYSGYLTLFLSISGSSVYAAVEVRICKNDPKRIVIETYGEVAKTVTGGMSLWFNKGTDKHFPTRDDFPETGSSNVNYINDATGKYYIWNETLYEEGSCWVKLNSTSSGVIMPYATTSYTFKESKRNGSTTIDCCKKCPSCGCKTCNITGLSLSYISPAVVEPTPLQWDANGRWTHLYPSFVETLSDTVTKYVYTTFEGMVYQVIRTINWDQSTNITTTIFEASVVSAWWYYQCHFELRWGVGSSDATPGGINPGREVGGNPPLIYIVNPYYGSTTGEILIGTDVRSGYSGTVSPSSTSSYGYTNNGDYTAFFASQKSFIEYKLKCDSLQFWIGDTGPHNSQNKLYYTDMDTGEVHLLGTLEPGQATGTITTSFPFDYLKNCMPDRFGFMYDCGSNPTTFSGTVSAAINFTGNTIHFDGTNNFDGDITYSCASDGQLSLTTTITTPYEQNTNESTPFDIGAPSRMDTNATPPTVIGADGSHFIQGTVYDGGHGYWVWNTVPIPNGHRCYVALQWIVSSFTRGYWAGSTGSYTLYFLNGTVLGSPRITISSIGTYNLTSTFIYNSSYVVDIEINYNSGAWNITGTLDLLKIYPRPYYCSLWYKERNGTWTRLLVAANTTSSSTTVTI